MSVDDLAKDFESRPAFCTPTYCSDKDVDSEEHREYYQLPKRSSIYSLPGYRLDQTHCRISGIHTPMAYISEKFGIIFSIHKEDTDAVALNVLLAGSRKIWFVIAPQHARKFEDAIAKDLGVKGRKCDSWVRHQNLYVPRAKLDEHKIYYCLFAQEVNQVVITFTGAYHQGFDAGPNIAEGVNYGDKYWTPEGFRFCNPRACGAHGDATPFAPRDGEDQETVGIQDPEKVEVELDPPNKKTSKAILRSNI